MSTSILKSISLIMCFLFTQFAFGQKPAPLTLMTLLKTVDCSYPKIIAARLEVAKARGDYLTALGKFDPNFDVSTRSLPQGGYISNYVDNQMNIPTLSNGLKLFGGYRTGRGDFPIYYQNFLTNSGGEYRAGLSIPLMRDRNIDKERASLFTQTETIAISRADVAVTKLTVYNEAIKAYWAWVQAGLQQKTFQSLLALAEQRQGAIEKRAERGDLPLIAVSENQQIIMQRQQWLNQARMMVNQTAIALSMYYRTPDGEPLRPHLNELPLTAQTTKPILTKSHVELDLQLSRHPALRRVDRYYRIVKLKQILAKNELLPNLDATAFSSKQYGTGGYPLLIPMATQIGVRFKFPVYQRQARGKVISTTNELKQVSTQKKLLCDQLKNRLKILWVTLNMYRKQIGLIQNQLFLANKVAAAERRKFYAGDSTLFLVNQREQTAAEVQLNLVSAESNMQQTQSLIQFFASPHLET